MIWHSQYRVNGFLVLTTVQFFCFVIKINRKRFSDKKKSFHGEIFVEGSTFLMEITNRSLSNLIDIWLAIRSVFSILISSFWNVNKTDQVHSLYQLFSLKIVWREQFYQTHPLCWRAFLIVSKISEWIPLWWNERTLFPI